MDDRITGLFANNEGNQYRECEGCHGGTGGFFFRDLLQSVSGRLYIKYIHDDMIPAGSSFGDHDHKGDKPSEEWYVCLSGNGVMTVNGKEYPMNPGDVSVCFCNGSHGLRNTGAGDMRILVIGASAAG